jgi:protein disulfide-isomerase
MDKQQRRYWDTTVSGNSIMASRTSILETLKYTTMTPPQIKPKSTISNFEKLIFDIRSAIGGHPFMSVGVLIGVVGSAVMFLRRRRRGRGGYFRLDEKDGLLGSGVNGKVD